jgi:hypothetical protein
VCLLQAPSWWGSLRQANFVSVAAAITLCPIRGLTVITIILHPLGCIINVDGEGGWGWGLYNKRWRGFGVGGVFLAHLLFFIKVVEDDDFAITGWPKELMIEVIEESFGKLIIPRDVRDEIFLIRRKIHHWDPLGGPTLLKDR